jgi:hypothetical protein
LYPQPRTYGERKAIVQDMLDSMTTLAPVFLDGPCNNWWSTYGPAPNNSYLIDTNGIVVSKHGWFDRYPDNIYCAIDSLLGTSSGNCTSVGGNSDFTFQMTSNDTVYGVAGTTISVDGELTNTGSDDILIYARRIANNMPAGWASSMCIDVCYSSSTDSTTFVLFADSVQPVHVYFYTSSAAAATGHVRLGFRNLDNLSNDTTFDAYGITTMPVGINSVNIQNKFSVYPNPASSEIKINLQLRNNFTVEIFNSFGESVMTEHNQRSIDISRMKNGIYFLKVNDGNAAYSCKFLKQ